MRTALYRCHRKAVALATVVIYVSELLIAGAGAVVADVQQLAIADEPVVGQTVTLLSTGERLLLGGERGGQPRREAWRRPAGRGAAEALMPGLSVARAWHTATVVPDGRVVVVGGLGSNGTTGTVEVFDPDTNRFERIEPHFAKSVDAPTVRARHGAVLLLDGQLLLIGGEQAPGVPARTATLWDVTTDVVRTVGLPDDTPILHPGLRLLPEGKVLVQSREGESWSFDSATLTWNREANLQQREQGLAAVVASLPQQDATDVPNDVRIGLQFGVPLAIDSVSERSVVLRGPDGEINVTLVTAEDGHLLFVKPVSTLEDGTVYRLQLRGLRDTAGRTARSARLRFRVAGARRETGGLPPTPTVSGPTIATAEGPPPTPPGQADEPSVWVPSAEALNGDWRINAPPSRWTELPPHKAPPGVTALAGQVLSLNGEPLKRIQVSIGAATARTDGTGRFLLRDIPGGLHEFVVDARPASTARATQGVFMIAMPIEAGRTNVLDYTIWLPVIDTAHATTIPSPTSDAVVVTTPLIPGLEIHIPPGTVIRDRNGTPVTSVSITPIPLDRAPFPLPRQSHAPVYFTMQPGGARVMNVDGSPGEGLRLTYPNYGGKIPGHSEVDLWGYDSGGRGWFRYGFGTVMHGGQSIEPAPHARLHVFTCAIADVLSALKAIAGSFFGDPVDVASGTFVYQQRDLVVPDVIPIEMQRTYLSGDRVSRSFGIGASHSYDMHITVALNAQAGTATWAHLVLSHGQRVHYGKTRMQLDSNGDGQYTPGADETVFDVSSTAVEEFRGSTLVWVPTGTVHWEVRLRDGRVLSIGVDQGTQHTYLESVGDRFGNVLKITRTTDPSHRITRIDSPNGRPVHFSYELVPPDDEVHRITQISDSIGRTVTYTYHPTGDAGADRLKRVTDAGGHTTDYTYYGGTNTCRDMKTITDSRHIPYLENIYFEPDDPSFTGNGGTYKEHVCAVKKQKGPDIPGVGQAVWEFDYMENEDCTLFLPGNVCSPEESWIVETTVTDPRGRRDQYRWDSGPETLVGGDTDLQHEPAAQPRGLLRHTAGVNLATNQQRTTLINGGPPNGTNDGLITSIEDFLDRTTALTYETVPVVLADGSTWNKPTANVTSVSVLDGTPNERQWQYTYEPSYGQLKTTTDPLGHTTTLLYDTQASLTGVLDASGVQTGITLHPSGHDAAGRVATASTYESAGGGGGNPPTNTWHFDYELGHLTSITDPAGQVTRRFIDEGGRVVAVTDALGRTTEFGWSARNQLEEVLDPLGAKTVIGYDENGNLTSMKDANDHTTTFTYTEADELETRVDALGQMESFVHDVNGNLVQHTDRRGYVTDFAYDDHDRWETSMFKTSAGATVSTIDVTYDRNGATQSEDVTLTDSKIAGTFVLDFNQFDELIWAGGPNGEVRYEYDDAGRRETLRWPGPNEAAAYTYDTANRVRQIDMANSGTPLGTVLMTYDAAGRLDLVTLPNGMVMDHAYDAVSRLTGITYKTVGGTVAGSVTYAYDAAGRRRQIGGTWSPLQLPDAVTSAVYNANNQLTQWNGEAFTYAYDANGNLQILPGVLLTWNERNELSKVQWPFASPARTWDYRYDPYGRRHEELDNGTSTRRYVYDGWNPVRIATQYPGNERLLSGPGLDAWLVKWDAFGARQAFLSDGLGSTVKLAADDGSYPATFSYTPFGKTTVAGSSWERMRYTGREQDPHGFYYYRGRYYDPVRSRFLSDDPIGFAGGDPNLYAYVGNDPLNFVDPTGEWGWIGVAAAAAQIAGAASAAGAAAGVLSGRKSAGGAAAGAALGAGLGAAGGALGRLAARGAGRLLSGGAARGARFVTNAAGETRIFLRGAEGTLEVSSHAAQRITQRGLSLDAVEEVISAQNPFQYFHNGVWKTGFYDPASQVFVGSANGTIRTVIPGATQNYINNLLGALP